MNKSNALLSKIVSFRTYAKYLPHLGRRELLSETINRNMNMHLDRFPNLSADIIKAYKQVHDLKVMPSMRGLQFGGEAILKNNARQYNCSFVHITYDRVFAEILYLLLSGVGVGYSIQSHHIKQLPRIKLPKEENLHIIHDSIEGWAESLNALISAYFNGAIRPIFDFSQIRSKGSYLVTTGAKAPGPEPLKHMLQLVELKLKAATGRQLTSIELHDIICIIADCVLSGGIRRAALICLFDKHDEKMLTCKHGSWWEKHPYRARANNSAVLLRSSTTYEEFCHVFDMCIQSNSGEPGFSWTNNIEMGYNPCHEISLHTNQFCNLTTTNLTQIKNEKDMQNRVYAAALIGTLQASYTQFPYLSQKWQQVTEEEALLGCSFTGIADSPNLTSDSLQKLAQLVLSVNEKYAKKIGINLAARATAIKPEGTASCVLGSSSGIHARFSNYYLRRVRMNSNDSLANYLMRVVPELVEADQFDKNGIVVTIPQESPKDCVTREQESVMEAFLRVLFYNKNWIEPGHRRGDNTHNVSCTLNYKQEEIEILKSTMWLQKNNYSGISLLPYDGHTYVQAPFETCSKEQFDKYDAMVADINLSEVLELDDNTNRAEILACAGSVCEIK